MILVMFECNLVSWYSLGMFLVYCSHKRLFQTVILECYKDSPLFITDTDYKYRWESLRVPPGITSFTFEVKASNDVFIALSAENSTPKFFYEIGNY